MAPFALLCLCGLTLSTVSVHAAATWADHMQVSASGRTITVMGANLAAFGSLWVVQFLVLDRLLFSARAPAGGPV